MVSINYVRIKKSYLCLIISILVIGLVTIVVSYVIIRNNAYNQLINSQILKVDEQLTVLEIILKLIKPTLNISVEFMLKFSIYNSTINDYINFTGLNDSSITNYISDIKPFYNISNNDRFIFEQKLSTITNTNSTIIDMMYNGSFNTSPIRDWYCPVIYTSPLNSKTFWIPGLDACNFNTFKPILSKFNKTNIIVSSTRRQIITNLNLIDFAIQTDNGFSLLSFYPNNIFIPLKNSSNIDSIFLYNNNQFYKTCVSCKTDERFYRSTIYGNDKLSFYLIFNDNNLDLNTFYLILTLVLFIIILSISFIFQINIGINKYTDANDMLGYVNHEIRNPLNCIKGMIEISLIDIEQGSQDSLPIVKKHLEIAQNVVQLLNHIVNDVLDYQKLIEGKMIIINTTITVNNFQQILFNIISPKLSENPNIEYIFINKSNINEFISDESRLIQILINFLTNSIKFTTSGTITLTISKHNNFIKFSVTDTGRGILTTDLNKIFQPYKQIGNIDSLRHGGIGLGLYLCKTLIQLMSGNIDFESQYGIGTTFWISIPIL